MLDDLTGIALAGGKSTRFGSDKASAELEGRPLLAHMVAALEQVTPEIVVVRAAGQELPALDVPARVVDDLYVGLGPLAGIVTGLEASSTAYAFVVSTDAPLLRPELVEYVVGRARRVGADIACPHVNGYPQPLLSAYRVAGCLSQFRDAVESRNLKVTAAFGGLHVETIDEDEVRSIDPDLRSFLNANTPEALETVARIFRGFR